MSYISVQHPFSPVFSHFFIAFAYSLQFVNKVSCFWDEITHFFLHLYLVYMGKENKFKSFPIKFPSFTVSSLFSAVKIFIISIRTVTVSLGSFYAKPFLNVILRSCCSVTLIHSTRYSFLGETRQINSRGAGLTHSFVLGRIARRYAC